MLEIGRAQRTIFVTRYLRLRELPREEGGGNGAARRLTILRIPPVQVTTATSTSSLVTRS
ncbi:hypothetical protein F4561_002533 [Lipingzhangella halophila]|uniref:Uncharacterized protein n=1 Tax=Lipingzhangella halophila TaxID=1783352 RepID=A0A7W7RGT1_9ACTN|nr:hypothetical protein [Lipingzhangella halophila]